MSKPPTSSSTAQQKPRKCKCGHDDSKHIMDEGAVHWVCLAWGSINDGQDGFEVCGCTDFEEE